jgi:hypothetical protein
VAMASPQSSIIAIFFIENSDERALHKATHILRMDLIITGTNHHDDLRREGGFSMNRLWQLLLQAL